MLTFGIYATGFLLVLVCLMMVLLVLMQRPKQEGLGAAFGAGVTDQLWGSQTTNVLQKGTVYLGVLFFVLSLTLTMLEAKKAREFTGMKVPTTAPVPVPLPAPVPAPAPAAVETPTTLETPAAPASVEIPVPAAPAADTPAPAPAVEPPAAPIETPAPVVPPAAAPEAPAAPPADK